MRHFLPTWTLHVVATAFQASAVSYLFFWAADAVRPGFVSRYFSVHVFGLLALVSGTLFAVYGEDVGSKEKRK